MNRILPGMLMPFLPVFLAIAQRSRFNHLVRILFNTASLFVCLALLNPLQASAASVFTGVPEKREILFEIQRNGKPFGQHRVVFLPERNGMMEVVVTISMSYDLGPIPLFNYIHKNNELWDKGGIKLMQSRTDDDGEIYTIRAERLKGGLNITANGETRLEPGVMWTTSYWNKGILKQKQLLNTQKGTIEQIKITPQGQEKILSEGREILADKYLIEASLPITIYYDSQTDEWAGLSFTVRGSRLDYRRI